MTPEHLRALTWHKSSYSNSSSNCVEVADIGSEIAVRDSKNPDGPVLVFGTQEWRAFVAAITTDRLSLS
jgi:Domain of unknown function (DUF397)